MDRGECFAGGRLAAQGVDALVSGDEAKVSTGL